MRKYATILGLIAAVVGFAVLGGGLRTPTFADSPTELSVDTFRANNTPVVTFGPILQDGQRYRVTVTGTFSKWPSSQWVDDGVCGGTPESAPMFPSPGAVNGFVGKDAAWTFAEPVGSSGCTEPHPRTGTAFQISLDGGVSFQNQAPDSVGSGPDSHHTYQYTVTGHGQPVAFKVDDTKTEDNYGVLHVKIELAVLDGIEFTQAAQTLQSVKALEDQVTDHKNTPIPIVAGKMAVMRVYFNAVAQGTDFKVHTTLDNIGGGAEDQNVHLEPGCNAKQRRDSTNGCNSSDFYFVPPEGDWSTPVSITDSANHVVYTHSFHFNSERSEPLTIVTVPVCDFKLGSFWGCGDDSAVDGLTGLLKAVAPTDSVSVVHSPLSIYRETTAADDAWWSGVLDQLASLGSANFLGLSGRVVWLGVVSNDLTSRSQAWSFPHQPIIGRDVSVVAMKLNVTPFGQAYTHQVLARAVARSLGLHYTDTIEPSASSPPGCYAKAADSNTDWPFVTNSIYSTGFDVVSGDAKPPDKFFDLMGFCSPSWVSEHTYSALVDKLKTGLFGNALTAAAAGDSWAVSGSITGQAATLEPLFTVDTPSSADAGTGAYRIEVRGSGGSVLSTRNFDAEPSSPEPAEGQQSVPGPAQFAELIGVQPGAERIVVLQGATELGSIDLTGAAPTVTFDSQPAAGGQQPISWTITDTDSTTFTSSLDYSSDGGSNWQPIAVGLPDSQLQADFDKLVGSANAMLRVRVSDGANTGEATTGPFTVGEKGPQVSIVSPGDGALIRAGQFAALQAAASDAEDGALTGTALSWSSSIDGALGTGASLPVANLSTGTHVITLTGHDSANHTASDTIRLTVWDAALIEGQANGDVDCDFSVTVLDALSIELKAAGVPRIQPFGCADIGSGSPEIGDVNCNGSIDAPDVIGVLRYVVGRPAPPPSGCRPVGF